MKIGLLMDSDVLAGTERHLVELCAAGAREGACLTLACPAESPMRAPIEEAGVRHVAVEKRGALDWRAVRVLSRLLRDRELDLIHAHNGRTALLGVLAVTLSRRGGCVVTQHFLEPAHVRGRGVAGRLRRFAHRWMNARILRVIAISAAVRDAMVARGAAAADRIAVIPNGISPPNPTSLGSPDEVRAGLGLNGTEQLIVCAARLAVEKDIGSLIQAMAVLHEQGFAGVCAVAGEGSERERLERRVDELKLGGVVRLLGFRSDTLALMNAADVVVLPSIAEPFGLVLIEAMALGKPVVATRVGGPVEIVDDGMTGILAPPSDPAALAKAMASILSDPERARRMGAAGRARYERCFTAERMARETLDVYQSCLTELKNGAGWER